MNINIISNNQCCLKMDVIGDYQLSLNTVSGMFNIVILNSEDYLKVGDIVIEGFDEYNTIDSDTLTRLINTQYVIETGDTTDELISYNMFNSKFTFSHPITDCSVRMKYLLGIKSFPASVSDVVASFIGPPYLFIHTSDLSALMRYSWQTKPQITSTDIYASIKNIVSVNLNTFTVGFPFSLIGSSFITDESKLKEVNFVITGLYGEEILFTNDIIYNFTLQQLPPTSPEVMTESMPETVNESMNESVNEPAPEQ